MKTIKKTIKRFIWKDWQDTLIFWFCAPVALVLVYVVASFGDK